MLKASGVLGWKMWLVLKKNSSAQVSSTSKSYKSSYIMVRLRLWVPVFDSWVTMAWPKCSDNMLHCERYVRVNNNMLPLKKIVCFIKNKDIHTISTCLLRVWFFQFILRCPAWRELIHLVVIVFVGLDNEKFEDDSQI